MTTTIPRERQHWRAVLEARWRTCLEELTELSLAYHHAAATTPGGLGAGSGPVQRETRRMLHRAVAARQRLADVEEALGRLATGRFGHCEVCGSEIGTGMLSVAPEARYCDECVSGYASDYEGMGR